MQIDFDSYDKPIRFCDLDPGDCFIMYTGDINELCLFMKIDVNAIEGPGFNCVCLNDGEVFRAKDDDLVKYRLEAKIIF